MVRGSLPTSRDFDRVIEAGVSVARPELVLYHLARDGQGPVRIGFAVTKRLGGAVVRNRVKRLLREAARPIIPRLIPGMDVVVVARPAATTADLSQLQRALEQSAARAGLLHTSEQQEEGTST